MFTISIDSLDSEGVEISNWALKFSLRLKSALEKVRKEISSRLTSEQTTIFSKHRKFSGSRKPRNLKFGSFGLTESQKKCFTTVNYKRPWAENNIFAIIIKYLDSEELKISNSVLMFLLRPQRAQIFYRFSSVENNILTIINFWIREFWDPNFSP